MSHRGHGLEIVIAAALLTGCGSLRSGEDNPDSGTAGDSSADTDAGSSGNSGGSDSDPSGSGGTGPTSGSDSDDPIFDVGTLGDGGPSIAAGCDKVDILFVIDNSESMLDEQDNLIDAVPGFVDAIEGLQDIEGFHLGVVSTDAYARQPEECRRVGALITQTGGDNSSGAMCGPWTEGRFMTEQDDVGSGFRCAAKLGTGGDGDEVPIDAMLTAVSPLLNQDGACNDGFIRDDALLVVVLITDEEDDHEMLGPLEIAGSEGDPPEWFEHIVDLKGGVEQNVAVLSLLGHPKPNACPDFQWDMFNGAEIANRLIAFTEMFPAGAYGDVCASNYDEFFATAVSHVQTACDEFVPPG
jgi:hypothetical protein